MTTKTFTSVFSDTRLSQVKEAFEAGQQSRQAEINQLQSQINEMAEVGLGQESALMEKDKRIENLISKWRTDAEQASKKSSEDWVENILNYCADGLEKALRGEHE